MNNNQIRVRDYLNSSSVERTDTLKFGEMLEGPNGDTWFTYKEEDLMSCTDLVLEEVSKENDLDKLIPIIVRRTFFSCSINTSGDVETKDRCSRSSLDLWRHVKYFFPEITIYSVMASLYRTQFNYRSIFCPDIHRRVFKNYDYYKEYCQGTYSRPDNILSSGDEYGLYINSDWRDIDK
jgi:hypothetical protein